MIIAEDEPGFGCHGCEEIVGKSGRKGELR